MQRKRNAESKSRPRNEAAWNSSKRMSAISTNATSDSTKKSIEAMTRLLLRFARIWNGELHFE